VCAGTRFLCLNREVEMAGNKTEKKQQAEIIKEVQIKQNHPKGQQGKKPHLKKAVIKDR